MRSVMRIVAVAAFAVVCGRTVADDPTGAEAPNLEAIAARFKIAIVWQAPVFPVGTTWGSIDGQVSDAANLARYRKLFCEEFSL